MLLCIYVFVPPKYVSNQVILPVPRLRIHGTVPPLPQRSSWHDAWLSTGYISTVWYLNKHRDNFTLLYWISWNFVWMSYHLCPCTLHS